jgi:hypothetical protein
MRVLQEAKAQINPKAETRRPKEGREPKPEVPESGLAE